MIERTHTRRTIWHHSLTDNGDVGTFRAYHMSVNGYEDIGYHYVILRDGTIQNGRDIRFVGAHAKWKNKDSIGVCLVGNFFKYEPSTEQLEAATELVHSIKHMILPNWVHPLKMEFHRPSWYPNACPGPKLDREDFLEIVARGYL